MSSPLLDSLRDLLEEDLDGVTVTPDGLRAVADTRYGEVTICIDHDEDEEDRGEDQSAALRVSIEVPPPAGSGPEFLVWCLETNTQFWGVKIGLDPDGMLSVHADVEGVSADAELAAELVDRVETVLQLLDEDLVEYCLANRLGTPTQRARWESRGPRAIVTDEEV